MPSNIASLLFIRQWLSRAPMLRHPKDLTHLTDLIQENDLTQLIHLLRPNNNNKTQEKKRVLRDSS